jgi:hypothetical protein
VNFSRANRVPDWAKIVTYVLVEKNSCMILIVEFMLQKAFLPLEQGWF